MVRLRMGRYVLGLAWGFVFVVTMGCSGAAKTPSAAPAASPQPQSPPPRSATSTIGTDYCERERTCDPSDFQTNYAGALCNGCDPMSRCILTHDRLATEPQCGAHYRAFLGCMIAVDCASFSKADDDGGPCAATSDRVAACLFPD